jgi:LemA protein
MKKNKWLIIGIIVLLAIIGGCGYNSMTKKDIMVDEAWANVEADYQRRLDLIPNLVETVKGYADFEKETLTQVQEARSRATQVQINADNITPEKLAQFQEAQAGVRSALGRLLAVAENYPNLKANENFLQLQAQLEGTENRISVSRKRFNEAVKTFNRAVRTFPNVIFARVFGYEEKAMFQAEEGAEKAPQVNF